MSTSTTGIAGTGVAPATGASGTGATATAGTGAAGSTPSGTAGTASTATAGTAAATAGTGTTAGAGGAGPMAGMAAPPPAGPVDYSKPGVEVMVDQPVGKGFEYPIASGDTGDGIAGCRDFAGGFGGDPADTNKFITIPPDLKMNMYSLYRPMVLEEGKKYPIVTWGNGTCALPEGYGTLLKHIASHGIFVVAANSRQVGQNSVMTKALDWAFAANKDMASPYFGRIDTERVGAAGHSQGGIATIAAARDMRIKTVIIFNGGASASKPFFTISGDRDLPFTTKSGMKSAVQGAQKAAWLWYHMVPERGSSDGHLTLITEPGRVVGPSITWFKATLEDDAEAKKWFNAPDCKLCGQDAMFEFGSKGI